MKSERTKIAVILAILSTIFLGVPTISSAAQISIFASKHQVNVIALTPANQADYWSAYSGEQLVKLKSSTAEAMVFWNKASKGKFKSSLKYIVAPAGSAISRCDARADWKQAQALAKLPTLTKYQHIIVINPSDTCGYAGYAEVLGSRVSVKLITPTNIAHEFGHNLGFSHSATVICPNDDFATITSQCTISQYADSTDVMGSDQVSAQSFISSAQRALVFKSPLIKIVGPGTYLITQNSPVGTAPILGFKTKTAEALIEFNDASRNGGLALGIDDIPGIQVRLINSAATKKLPVVGESGIGTLALGHIVGKDNSGACAGACHTDLRFHVGDSVKIPDSGFTLYVGSGDRNGLTVTIAKSSESSLSKAPGNPVILTPLETSMVQGAQLSWSAPANAAKLAGYIILGKLPIAVPGRDPLVPVIVGYTGAKTTTFEMPAQIFPGNEFLTLAVVGIDKYGHRSPATFYDFMTRTP
ncbi:unannotated protein [freshwater metagenome]|uniref:Unannotated protein n=1 Tax=freshwater metagenome TaxID=449393 RepID=A0A6J7XVK8_9ZZZZ|nr:hypothetical protein [Actinomycetota bacterium]